MKNIPTLIVMMGLSGSGKSTLARHFYIEDGDIVVKDNVNDTGNPVIHSSDSLREELFGDVAEQTRNDELFVELHRRIKRDLCSGKSVIYDATNLNKKRRVAFLRELKNIECRKVCTATMASLEDCLKNNANRDRKVPNEVIKRQYANWQPPHFHEGFDVIYFAFLQGDGYDEAPYSAKLCADQMDGFDQENSHHKLTLGDHCKKAYDYCVEHAPDNPVLHIAAYLHDIGKLETKSRLNRQGVDDGNCHYYNHQNVGAYHAAFILHDQGYPVNDEVDVLNLIYFHMHPFTSWKQSEKALERDRLLIGDNLYNDILLLHEADVAAH